MREPLGQHAARTARRDQPGAPSLARIVAAPARQEAPLRVEVHHQPGVARDVRGWKPSGGVWPRTGDTAVVIETDIPSGRALVCLTWWTDRAGLPTTPGG